MKNEELRIKNEECGVNRVRPSLRIAERPLGAAVKGIWRLFTKNTGLCELVRGGIETDACPVPVG